MSVLETKGLSVHFGGVVAVDEVDIAVQPGQLVGLIGPNGAGKTTLIDAVTGFVPAMGTVSLEGEDITALAPHARATRGLARTWQASELFDDLSVRENLAVAAKRPSVGGILKEIFTGGSKDDDPAIEQALELLEIGWAADLYPDELTQGQRKLVGVARAIAMHPKLLLLDEPAAGLDTHESLELGKKLRSLVDGGTPMLLIDHDMGLVLGICDQIVVIEFGKVIARGTPDEIRKDPKVVEAYLGSAAEEIKDEISQETA